MSDLVFFDSRGEAVAYKDADDDVIFLWKGQPVAILDDESVFAFDGRHLGWFIDGWIRDHGGAAVYFTEDATDGPPRPARAARPARGTRGARCSSASTASSTALALMVESFGGPGVL